MNILFSGGSSFSGMWFIKELSQAGHQITAIFQKTQESYEGLRRLRIQQISSASKLVYQTAFGDENFIKLIESQPWDLFCHHAADVNNYKSLDFNVGLALAKNTRNIKNVLSSLHHSSCNKILLTGTVFEQNEGLGTEDLRAVSPYGFSKGLTAEVFTYYSQLMKMKLAKFVIPNPFGPFEEKRFTTYLIESWLTKQRACVNTPHYIRDNIPIKLLAKAYAKFASTINAEPGIEKYNPSCYTESQAEFTRRFANEMKHRLNLLCEYEINDQKEFLEPLKRINFEKINWQLLDWNEEKDWDDLADYYLCYGSRGVV